MANFTISSKSKKIELILKLCTNIPTPKGKISAVNLQRVQSLWRIIEIEYSDIHNFFAFFFWNFRIHVHPTAETEIIRRNWVSGFCLIWLRNQIWIITVPLFQCQKNSHCSSSVCHIPPYVTFFWCTALIQKSRFRWIPKGIIAGPTDDSS